MKLPSFRDRVDVIVRILFGAFIAVGCLMVVLPFGTAILGSAVIAVVSWPLFERIRRGCKNSSTIASMVMLSALTFLIVLPITALSVVSAQKLPVLIQSLRNWINAGFALPEFLREIPYVGPWLFDELSHFLGSQQEMIAAAQKLFDPLSSLLLKSAVTLGDGLFQLCIMLFILFFFYRDGEYLARKSYALLQRMSGNLASEVGNIIINTTRSVVFGIVGSAAGQGIVALIGFWIAGVPGALLLGVAVFVLSVVPIGPPLVWGPVAIWLYYQGHAGMAIFIVLWGALAVSSVDNFLKPLLISKGASLPISLIYLGVFGGVLAFGFMGIIIGPVLIAVGIAMSKTWLSVSNTLNSLNQPTKETIKELRHLSVNPLDDSETESETPSDNDGSHSSSKLVEGIRNKISKILKDNKDKEKE